MDDYISRQAAIEHAKMAAATARQQKELSIPNIVNHYFKPLASADVVEGDKAQKEIDYWHDKAQSYEQTILKLSLNKADVVEVVRCKDCKYAKYDKSIDRYDCRNWGLDGDEYTEADDFCSYGERADK